MENKENGENKNNNKSKKILVISVIIVILILLVGLSFVVINLKNKDNSVNIYEDNIGIYDEVKIYENEKVEKIEKVGKKDTEAPVINGVSDKEIFVGEEIDLLAGITAVDEVDGEVKVTTESSVDTSTIGEYIVVITASDNAGNTATKEYKVVVKEKEQEEQEQSQEQGQVQEVEVVEENPITYVGSETVPEVISSETKYGVLFNTIKDTVYDIYSDGSRVVNTSYTYQNIDHSGYSATTNDLLSEARANKNSYYSLLSEVLTYTNNYRSEAGKEALVLDDELCVAASVRAMELAYADNFSHTRPNGTSCFTIIDELNISCTWGSGENIAWGQPTPSSVCTSWRNSEGHYQNMIGNYTRLGVGLCILNNNYYWVQLFVQG